MKTKILAIFILLLPFLLAECSEEKEHDGMDGHTGCTLSYNPAVTELKWTAFKFTEKVGVGGTFKEIKVDAIKDASEPAALLNGLKFEIGTGSVNSNHEERDERIRSFFFGSMNEGGMIRGSISGITDATSGPANLELTLNGITKTIPVQYKIMNDLEAEIWGKLELTSWNAEKSIDSLNEACYDLHKGEDGISKLWPEVEIRAYTRLDRNCP